MSMLMNKPMWIYWAAYSTLSAVLFGVFYAATYLLASKWWFALIVIVAIGMIWGSIEFTKKARIEKPLQEG